MWTLRDTQSVSASDLRRSFSAAGTLRIIVVLFSICVFIVIH